MSDVRTLLKKRPLLFDGGMGTYYKGAPGRECEQANRLDPEGIRAVHRAYLAAGADAIKTNTFGLPRMAAAQDPEWEALADAGWKLAAEAAAGTDAAVFADLGPAPDTEGLSAAQVYTAVALRFAALGAKNYLFETLSSDTGVLDAVRALRETVPDAFVQVSFAVLPDGYTREGQHCRALVRRMAGVTDRKYLFEISDAIAARDAVKALQEIAALRQQSVDMRRLCMELAGHYRNLMLSALPGGTDLLTGTSPEEEAAYAARKDFPQAEAVRAVNAFGAALEKMARDKMSVRQADRLVDQMLAAPNGPSPCRRTIPMVRDVRFFVNTLQHAVDLMTQKGIAATTRCDKHDGCLEYIVRIPVSSDGTAGKVENGAKEEEGEFEVKV